MVEPTVMVSITLLRNLQNNMTRPKSPSRNPNPMQSAFWHILAASILAPPSTNSPSQRPNRHDAILPRRNRRR